MEIHLIAHNQCDFLDSGMSPIQDAMSGMTGLRTVRIVSLLPGGRGGFGGYLLEGFRQALQSSTAAEVVILNNVAEGVSITR